MYVGMYVYVICNVCGEDGKMNDISTHGIVSGAGAYDSSEGVAAARFLLTDGRRVGLRQGARVQRHHHPPPLRPAHARASRHHLTQLFTH